MLFHTIGHDFKHDENFELIRPNGLKEYLLLIIRSDAWFVINNEKMLLKPNSMIILEKDLPHSFGALGSVYINDWVAFTYDCDSEGYLFDKIPFNRFVESKQTVETCSNIVSLMQGERLFGEKDKDMMLNLLFKALLLKLKNAFGGEYNDVHYSTLTEIRRKIYNAPAEKYTVQMFADMSYMSKSYFQHLYKKYFHTTPIEDVIASRIDYAKQLLCATNFSVRLISEMLNYGNDMQFIKQFKQVTGKTPGQYRILNGG